jgi:hypothetical protein
LSILIIPIKTKKTIWNGFLRSLFDFDVVALVELVDPTIGGGELLLAGEERMAIAASIDAQFLGGRARHEGVPAGGAGYRHFKVLGVNASFHVFSPSAMISIVIVSFLREHRYYNKEEDKKQAQYIDQKTREKTPSFCLNGGKKMKNGGPGGPPIRTWFSFRFFAG